jgi:hypothetical protein
MSDFRSPSPSNPSIWSRPAEPPDTHLTQRVRKRVEGLPDWDPLPPGEIVVRRSRQS